MGDITDRYKELVPTPRDGYTRMGVRSHAKGTFLTEVKPGQQIEEQELSKVRADNLVVNIVFAWEHAVAITSEEDAKALVSHRFPQFSFHDDMEPGFFRYATLDEDFRRHLWLASPSGAGRNKTLNIGTMLEYEFTLPSRREQAEIAKLFDRLDNLITLHQRKQGSIPNPHAEHGLAITNPLVTRSWWIASRSSRIPTVTTVDAVEATNRCGNCNALPSLGSSLRKSPQNDKVRSSSEGNSLIPREGVKDCLFSIPWHK